MSKWAITDGAAGRLCILPVGPVVDARLPYGYTIHKEVECCGLLEAMGILHEFESESDPGYFETAQRRIKEVENGLLRL